MEIKRGEIEGLVEIQPKVFGDERGYFFESFNLLKYKEFIKDLSFVQ
ncbi:MAG: dTDP-4-dehydrorhamnose 3,5-epimerase, partial [Crocinitomicaceae bacterium]|nr:dTDP-4-dehydrorhamnose 3,5-epimerase [Crocinitomicaceae bacterium]